MTKEFHQEISDLNLRRLQGLLFTGITCIVLALIVTHAFSVTGIGQSRFVLWGDLAASLIALAATWRLRKSPVASRWHKAFLVVMVAVFLLVMDIYYFTLLASSGQNPVYILAVIATGTLFVMRPQAGLGLILGNHLIYTALLLGKPWNDLPILPIWLENTTGAALAGLISVFLFQARCREFFQRRTLQLRNHQLNEIMAITAHDLRSPLCGVRDLLKLAPGMPLEQGRDMLFEARASCERMLSMVTQLLNAHAAEQQQNTSLSREDLRPYVNAAVDRARAIAVRSLQLTAEIPGDPAFAWINCSALPQVLDNLLANAVRFSPPEGKIAIRLFPEASFWICDIADEGSGVAMEDRARLFEKFYRGKTQPAARTEGNGLGLYIAATFMAAMRGQVEYRPGPGGSVFRLKFSREKS